MSDVVQLSDYRKPPPKLDRGKREKSKYELYPLPFFDAEAKNVWCVRSTGNYVKDCEIGREYGYEFLKSCDGSNGWRTLLSDIVGDMTRAGPSGRYPDGRPRINGIVIGFMTVIGGAVAAYVQSSRN